MNQVKLDRLLTTMLDLRHALATADWNDVDRWAELVQGALGELADAIQNEVSHAKKTLANIGDINPDFQNSPVTERHVETMRDELIQLGERIHELRAEIRQGPPTHPLEMIQLRLRGEEVADAVTKVRKTVTGFS